MKYSKFDNFMQRTQEPYQVQQFRSVTLADDTVKKTSLSLQNIERQERRLQNEYREKYGFRMKKLNAMMSSDDDSKKGRREQRSYNQYEEERKRRKN